MNDYLDYLAHYRTPGSKNGISHTPGYDAVGKPAMSAAERKAARKAYKKEIKNAKNYDYKTSEKYKSANENNKLVRDFVHQTRVHNWGKKTANRLDYIADNYDKKAYNKYRNSQFAKQLVGSMAAFTGARLTAFYVGNALRNPSGAKRNVARGKEIVKNIITNVKNASMHAQTKVFKTIITDANGKVINRSFKQMYSQAANIGTSLIRR